MKILILGATGMLGHKLVLGLKNNFEVAGTARDLTLLENNHFKNLKFYQTGIHDFLEDYKKIIAEFMPSIVINCIGTIKHLAGKKATQDFVWANAWLPHALAGITSEKRIKLVNFSTDCVFSGLKGRPYTLGDTPDPADIYGMSKYLGEISDPYCLTLRTSIIGPELRGKVSLVEWAISQKSKHVKGYANALYSGFPSIEIAQILSRIFIDHPDLDGLWHVASPGISKADLLALLNNSLHLDLKIKNFEDHICDRRLDGSAFAEKTGIISPPWQQLVHAMAKDYYQFKDLYCQ